MLKEVKHPNIVDLRDVVCDKGNKLYLIMEFANMDLRDFIEKWPDAKLPMPVIKSIMY